MKGLRVSLALVCFTVLGILASLCSILREQEGFTELPSVHLNRRRGGCSRERGVFYGIFTTVHRRAQRDVFRRHVFCEGGVDNYTVRFIIGRPSNRNELNLLAEESDRYGDIDILGCQENMNRGKTYSYFRHVYTYHPCYSFYAKVDDDTAFLPGKMTSYLLSRQSVGPVYLGRKLQRAPWHYLESFRAWFKNDFGGMMWYFNLNHYHAGMFYAMNDKAVTGLIALNVSHVLGDEDVRTGHWMDLVGSEVVDVSTLFHDHPDTCGPERISLNDSWCPNITRRSLAVHQCKSLGRLVDGLTQMCVMNRVS